MHIEGDVDTTARNCNCGSSKLEKEVSREALVASVFSSFQLTPRRRSHHKEINRVQAVDQPMLDAEAMAPKMVIQIIRGAHSST